MYIIIEFSTKWWQGQIFFSSEWCVGGLKMFQQSYGGYQNVFFCDVERFAPTPPPPPPNHQPINNDATLHTD